MPNRVKLQSLYSRMADEQRALLLQAADVEPLPSFGALRYIASLEGAIEAVEAMMDERSEGTEGLARKADMLPQSAKSSPESKTMATGTLKWFSVVKGYGFIQPEGGGSDVFVHLSAVDRAGLEDLKEGQKVTYELQSDKRTGKKSADQLKVI